MAASSVVGLRRHEDQEPRRPVNASCDPSLEALLGPLVAGVPAVLGEELVGMYLYGSAVSGGFDPGVSDVDLVAVVRRDVESIDLAGLDRMHRQAIERHPDWSDRLEIVYVDRSELASPAMSPASLAVISPGEPFHLTGPVSDWLQNWYLVRETGVALFGPPAREVIPPIGHGAFIDAVVRYAAYLRGSVERQVTPSVLAYAVISACRSLRTVRTGTHASKQESAAWVRARMPEWAWVLDEALACRVSRGAVGLDDERTYVAAVDLTRRLADEVAVSRRPDPRPRPRSTHDTHG